MKRKSWVILAALLLLTGCAKNIENGVLLLEEEKYEEAIRVFQKDIEKGKHLDEAYRGMGLAHFEMEEYKEAAKALESALKNGAKKGATLYGVLGACYMEQGLYEKTADTYKKALKQEDITDELKQEIEYNLIGVYEKLYDWDNAKKQAEKYAEDYPDDAKADKEVQFLETR